MTISQQCECLLFELAQVARPIPRNETVEAASWRWEREKRVLGWANSILEELPDFARVIASVSLPRVDMDALGSGRVELVNRPWSL